MFGISKSKEAEVLSHWYIPVPNFNASTQDFYTAVERELKNEKVPGLDISRVELSEGGIMSDNRIYLRMQRERLVFDVCAAPFGANYFFSCRFAELPVKVSLFAIIMLLLAFLIIFFLIMNRIGFFQTTFLGIATLALGIYTLRNLVSLGLSDVDASLVQIPVFGPMYERFFRKETYYRQDTRLVYLSVVDGVVKRLVEQETAAKGVKLLTQYEYGPILGELYKPRPFGSCEKQETE